MNIRDMNKPATSKQLNETMAKKFGTKIDVESFTLEQLQDARNKIRSKVFDIETNESFGGLPNNKTYSKNKLFLDVLNAAISERDDIQEADKKPDADGDGVPDWADKKPGKDDNAEDKDKKPKKGLSAKQKKLPAGLQKAIAKKNESVVKEGAMKAVCKDCGDTFGTPTTDCKNDCNDPTQDCWVKESDYMKETKHIDEGKDIINNYYASLLKEGEEDKAELVMASKDMVDRLTGWMEDTAEMQTESMLELADAIRDEMGAQQSEAFTNAVKPALEQLYASMETTRVALTTGVGMLTGEGEAPAMDMGDEEPAMDAMDEPDMEPTDDMDMETDGFDAAAPAAGGEDEAGRAKRESRMQKKKMIETSRRLGSILSKPSK